MDQITADARRHYTAPSLTVRIADRLGELFPENGKLTVTDLAPLDQFHTGGLAATKAFADLVGLNDTDVVLDVGCGLGGPARYLASTFGCSVVGVDLSPDFIDAAQYLTERTGLADRLAFREGDALHLPVDDAAFDVVWMQHVAMNIADREGLYREVRRTLRPGGKLATFDVVSLGGAVHYPTPWATAAASSFLLTEPMMRGALVDAGFKILEWRDESLTAKGWFAASAASPPSSGLNLALVMGETFPARGRNLALNLQEGRIAILSAVAERTP